jgi:putative endopeptidase
MPRSRTLKTAAPIVAACALAALCAASPKPAGEPHYLPRALDPLVQDIDSTASPRVDFFRYANGGWIRKHPIPPTERGSSIAIEIRDQVYAQLRGICESAASSEASQGTEEQKIGDFWAVAMDSSRIDRQGTEPLKEEFARIDAAGAREDLERLIASEHVIGLRPLYNLYVGQDDKNSESYVVFLSQGGLGLPDRDYYFLDDSTTTEIRSRYPVHVAKMFRLLGRDEASAQAAARSVLAIETALARRSRTIEQQRDPYANYNKMSLAELGRLTPGMDWKAQLAAMGIPPVDSVVVRQPEFCACADSALGAFAITAWKDYLRWNLINTFADHLGKEIDLEDFRFYGTLMGGAQEQRPRWKRVLDAEEGSIGELMGQVWVRRYCSPGTKLRYEKLVDAIFDAYRDRIRRVSWMSGPTKEKALAKLDHVTKKVGYPDKWRDYSALAIERDSFARNQMRVNAWWFRYYVDKLGKPVDRTEWDMTPQTYNAYYDGSKVEIVLPAAAFLIPGLPDSLLDDAILYSYAGASTIGHEITHGFDDEGRQYDENGNMRSWWTAQDSARFTERAQLLVKQFDAYKVGDKHVRGYATLGENIADLGGIVIALDAFHKTEQWKRGEIINGLTPDQRFFLGYALSWAGQRRPEMLAQLIMTDVHAPEFLRVNGPLSNLPEFYAAFGVKPGDPMYREENDRVAIW